MRGIFGFCISFWLIIWLSGCASTLEPIKRDWPHVVISKDFVESIEHYNSSDPIYYSDNSTWMNTKYLDTSIYEMTESTNDGDYWQATDMADHNFMVFQVEADQQDSVNNILWVAYITGKPELSLLKEGFLLNGSKLDNGNKSQEPRAGFGNNKEDGVYPVHYVVRAVKMDVGYDRYYNVDDRDAQDTRYIVSWDSKALPGVDFIRQYNLHNKLLPSISAIDVSSGSNEAIIDIRRGQYIQLCWRTASGSIDFLRVDPLRTSDITLEGLGLYEFNNDYLLEIIGMPEIDKNNLEADWRKLKPMRYANLENYKQSGFIRVSTIDIIDPRYVTIKNWLIEVGAVGFNPTNLVVQGSFLISPQLLRSKALGLYIKYKNSVQYP